MGVTVAMVVMALVTATFGVAAAPSTRAVMVLHCLLRDGAIVVYGVSQPWPDVASVPTFCLFWLEGRGRRKERKVLGRGWWKQRIAERVAVGAGAGVAACYGHPRRPRRDYGHHRHLHYLRGRLGLLRALPAQGRALRSDSYD